MMKISLDFLKIQILTNIRGIFLHISLKFPKSTERIIIGSSLDNRLKKPIFGVFGEK